jgi:YVTN family beta-propeller protein
MGSQGTRFVVTAILGIAAVGCVAQISPTAPHAGHLRAYVTNSRSNTVSVIDLHDHVVLDPLSIGPFLRGVAVSPDGLVYVASQLNDTVSIIRMRDNRVIGAIPTAQGPYGVAVSPDGKEVYVTQAGHFPRYGKTVSVIDATARKVVATIPVGNQPIGIAVSPDGRWLYVANQFGPDDSKGNTSGLSVIEVATRTSRTIELDAGMATGITVSPDGVYVYVAHEVPSGVVRVVRTSDLTTVAKVTVGNGPFGVAASPDGQHVYVANLGTAEGDETASVIRTADWSVVDTITVGKVPVGIAVSPDGRQILTANRMSNTVSVIDAATRQVTATFPVGDEPWALGNFIGVVPER